MSTQLHPDDRVEVQWDRHGWLPDTVGIVQGCPDAGETFCRVRVEMDNGFPCDGSGFHPDCVRAQ